jgi:hypothetical protein
MSLQDLPMLKRWERAKKDDTVAEYYTSAEPAGQLHRHIVRRPFEPVLTRIYEGPREYCPLPHNA